MPILPWIEKKVMGRNDQLPFVHLYGDAVHMLIVFFSRCGF